MEEKPQAPMPVIHEDLEKLSPGVLAAMCSNLARGCEKQYQAEEAALYQQLAAKFRLVAAIEKHHEERYRALLHNVETAQVFQKSQIKVWECRNCGHIVTGPSAPAVCPTCAHPQSFFELNCENY